MSDSNKRNFIVHGSILAMAGILVRIIGMLYRIPVLNIIGSEGNGIYSVAFNIYNIMLVLSSYGLPMAVSKLVSARFSTKQYKSAKRVLRCSMIIAVISGGCAALLVFFGADFIENVIYNGGLPGLAIPLRVLAPTIFLVAVLGVIRGFFQGQGTMIPTAVSQIFEQIINAIVSIAAGYGMMKGFASSPEVAAYGAAGSTMGTALGALTALLFMGFLYSVYNPTFSRMVRKDRHRVRETDGQICSVIIFTMVPIILGQTFYQISALIDDVMFSNIMVGRDISNSITTDLGNFGSSYSLLISIPQGIATAMSASMLPSIVASFSIGEFEEIHNKITKTLKTTMFVAVPSFAGLVILGQPIIKLLFSRYDSAQGAMMLKIGAIAVVFYTLSTVTGSALQAINKMKLPMIHSFISLVIHVVLVFVLLKFSALGIYALVIGNATFPVIIFILNFRALYYESDYELPVISVFANPVISSLIMGICSGIAYKALFASSGSNALSLIMAMCVAFVSYFGPYILINKSGIFERYN